MAVVLEGGCRVSQMREGEPLTNGTLRIWNRIGRATGAQAISLRVMEFAPGLSPALRNDDSDEILYLLDAGIGYSSMMRSAAPKSRNSSARFRPAARPIIFIATKKCFSSCAAQDACGPAKPTRQSRRARASICRKAWCIALKIRARVNCV